MADRYVDPAAAGTNDGSSWTNAWTTMAAAIAGTNSTAPAAGETVFMRGSESVASQIILNISGTYASPISWIGCNASGTVDGTRYVLNTGDNAIHGIDCRMEYSILKNIEITSGVSGAGNGLFGSSAGNGRYNLFQNLYIHDMVGAGMYGGNYIAWNNYIRCRSINNSSYGAFQCRYSSWFFCEFTDNGSDGFNDAGSYTHHGCIFNDNTSRGLLQYGNAGVATNCVAHGNGTYGIESYQGTVVASRSTNSTTGGIRNIATSFFGVAMRNYTDQSVTGFFDEVTDDGGTSTNTESGTDADDGYVNSSGGDFTLASGATGEDIEIVINASNSHWTSAGLRREEPAGGGGGGGGIKLAGLGGGLAG